MGKRSGKNRSKRGALVVGGCGRNWPNGESGENGMAGSEKQPTYSDI